MAQAVTYIAVQHDSSRDAAGLAYQYVEDDTTAQSRACMKLSRMFERAAGGMEPCKVTVLQDAYGTFGTCTVTVVVASCAAGDWLYVGPVGLRCVTGAVTALQDTWSKDTSDTAAATSLKNAINNNTFLAQYVVATSSAGVVTITSRLPGPICHLISVRKEVATDGALLLRGATRVVQDCLSTTGGTKPSATITCVFANLDDADTVTIAGKVLTGDTTTPADADEFEVATDDANVAATLAVAVNQAEEIRGHVIATAAAGVVTLTSRVPGTGINAMTLAVSDADGTVLSGSTMTDGSTHVLEAPRAFAKGLV